MGAPGDIDEALRRGRGGDRDAFAILLREHQSMVFSIGWNYLRNEAAAEELAQEVFLELFQNIRSIESPAHLIFCLRKVMTHRCIDYSRRQRNRPSLALQEVPEPSATPTSETTPGDSVCPSATAARCSLRFPGDSMRTSEASEPREPTPSASVLPSSFSTAGNRRWERGAARWSLHLMSWMP